MTRVAPNVDKLCSELAECDVVASVLMDPACTPSVLEILGPEDFFDERRRLIFSATVDVWKTAPKYELGMVFCELERTGNLEKAGGKAYLTRLVDNLVSSANAKYYAGIVRDRRRYRDLLKTTDEMARSVAEGDDVDALTEEVQQKAMGLTACRQDTVFAVSDHCMDWAASALEEKSPGIFTGFAAVDAIVDGFDPSDFVIVAGRPSMGKTSLAIQVALLAAQQGKTALIFTLEMTAKALTVRLISQLSGIPRKFAIYNEDRWKGGAEKLKSMPIVIAEGRTTSEQQLALLRSRKNLGPVDLVVVDYLTLMTAPGRNRYEQVSEISRSLKLMALQEGLPVLAAAQLNRANESRENHRPRMSDLRDSGSIEQDADVILLLHREDYYRKQRDPATQELDGVAEVVVSKNRNGPTGFTRLKFLEELMMFGDLDEC